MLLRTLGEIRLEGGPGVLAGRRKDLALLAYLARRSPRPVPRAELADLLWEDRDEGRARQSLRQALLELKRVVGEGLTTEAEHARLDPEAVVLDVKEFERAISQGRLDEGVAWWNGDFLAEMEDAAGETLRVWLEIERESLRRSLGFALDRLSAEAVGGGDWERAIGWAERWTRFVPDDEHAHIRLIETLRLAGKVSEARVRYTTIVARIRSELEREPSAEMAALGLRIERELSQDHALHRPGSAALFTPDLVGRAAALAELSAAWTAARAGQHTVVLVEGESGIGKTRLIEEFLRRTEVSGSAVVVRLSAAELGSEGKTLAVSLLGGLAAAPGLGATTPATLSTMAAHVPAIRERFPGVVVGTTETSLEAAAAEAISAVAEERPVVLFVDDLEEGDSAMRVSFARVAPLVGGRVLTILALGEDEGSLHPPAAMAAGMRPRRLKLPPLTLAEVEALIASMVVLPLSERHALAVRLYEEGGGNPLYTIELAAALVDEGVLAVGERGAWTLVHPEHGSVPLPGSLRAIIQRRTGSLSEEARIVAVAVARYGPVADEAASREAAALPRDRFDAGRDELVMRRLLRTVQPPAGGYQFHHQLVRRAILEDAARRERDLAGREAALSRSVRRKGLAVAAVVALAALVVAGLAIRRSTDRPPPGTGHQMQVLVAPFEVTSDSAAADSAAARSLAFALERALATRTPAPALVHGTLIRMRRADTLAIPNRSTAREVALRAGVPLLLVPSVTRDEGRLTLAYRIDNAATGQTVRVRQQERSGAPRVSTLASALVKSVDKDVTAAATQVPALEPLPPVTTVSLDALRAYASGNRFIHMGEDAGMAMFRRAVAIDTAFSSAQARLAYLSWFEYDQRTAAQHAAVALRNLEGLPPAERLQARLNAAHAVEDWATAIECARALLELNPTSFYPWATLGQILYFDRQHSAALVAFDSAIVRSTPRPEAWVMGNRATVLPRLGRMKEGAAAYEETFAADSTFLRQEFVNHEYGVTLVRLGRVAQARAAYAARLAGTREERAGGLRSLALLEAHGGHFARARELLDEAVTGSTAADDTLGAALAHLLRAEVVMTQGDTGRAVSDLLAVGRYAGARPLPYEVLSHAVKLLARARQRAQAASLLSRLWSQTTAVSSIARSRLLIAEGEVLLAHGRAREARSAIERGLALDQTTEAKESAAFVAAATGDLANAAQRYDSLAADRGIDWDGHAVIELGRYLAGRTWERAGHPDRARARYQAFLAEWADEPADSNLPAVIDARSRLAAANPSR